MSTPDSAWTWVAGTGHRERRSGDQAWVDEQLPQAAVWLRDVAGTKVGISGLALGFDMDWAEAVLDAGMILWAAIPYIEQPSRWSAANRARWQRLRAAASRERIVGEIPADLPKAARSARANQLLFKRNIHMLRPARAVITDWEPGRLDGGTAGALLHAATLGMPGVHLDPVSRHVNFELPGVDQLQRYALQNTTCKHVAFVGTRADTTQLLAALTAAHFPDWRVRPATLRQRWDDGCDDCIHELAVSGRTAVPA